MAQRKINKSLIEPISGLEDKVNECVKFIFCREGSKIPIKKIEITKHLTDIYEVSTKQVDIILTSAKEELKRVYGYNLVEVERKNPKEYMIVLDQPDDSLISSVTNPLHRMQLIAALTHIFMTSGPVSEDEMWKFLIEAKLLKENDHNEMKNFSYTFTKQLYLTHFKEGKDIQSKFFFDWGPRAHKELPKMYILEKVAKALNKKASDWNEQYKIASTTQKNNN